MLFGIWDYLTIGLYVIATLTIGFWVSRRIRSGQDFFLAGRSLPWWAVGTSLVATDIGGTDIIGVGGAAYRYGIAVANFEWIGCVPAMIVAAFVIIPHLWRIGVQTVPEFLERRYNVTMRLLAAGCWLVFMASNLGVMLFASAKMLTVSLGIQFPTDGPWGWLHGHELELLVVMLGLIVASYTLAGGLSAVVYTDVLQCAVMIGGCLLVLILAVYRLGGWSNFLAQIEAQGGPGSGNHLELILPVDTQTPFPWTGIFFGLALVLSPAYWFGNQAIVQRALGARSEFEAKASYVWGALLKNGIPFLIALPGLAALALFPNLPDGDEAYPRLAARLLPVGLRGVFLAAFIAALMSSVDSYLNSASAIAVHDFLRRLWHRPETPPIVRWGRITTALFAIWGMLFAIWLSRLQGPSIYGIFQTLMSFFQGPSLAILLAGLFWRRATGVGAVAGFLSGVATSIILFAMNTSLVTNATGWRPLFQISEPFLYYSVWSFIIASATLVIFSYLSHPEPKQRIAQMICSGRKLP